MKTWTLYLMAVLYILAGLNHFRAPRLYSAMMPPLLPRPDLLIAVSGAAEVGLGLLLFWPRARPYAAWGIIALLVAVFPANLRMYELRDSVFHRLPSWLLIARLPLQLVLIGWAYLYT